MGICLSCLRPSHDDDDEMNNETQPLLPNDQLLQQKQRDLIAREEQYKEERILQLEKLINQTRDVLIDSNNLFLEQSFNSMSNGNLPRVVNKISDAKELDNEGVEDEVFKVKLDVGPLYMNLDKMLTNV